MIARKHVVWRLGLDVGSDSIGWAVFRLDRRSEPDRLLGGGVRLFDGGREPRKHESFAKDRGLLRRMRRRLRGRKWRRDQLIAKLNELGLAPPNSPPLEIYRWRAEAAQREVDPSTLAAILLHMTRHRGFKSPRLGRPAQAEDDKKADDQDQDDDTGEDEEIGRWAKAEDTLRAAMREAKVKTVGQLLNDYLATRGFVRARRGHENLAVPTRLLLREEFAVIRAVQAPHLGLKPGDWEDLADLMFEQRPLREPQPGRCTFFPQEHRLPRCLPSAQRFRTRQVLCNLRVTEGIVGETRALTPEEFATLAKRLDEGGTHSWASLRAAIGAKRGAKFTIEIERRPGQSKKAAREVEGDETAGLFGELIPEWNRRSIIERDGIVSDLRKIQRERRKLLAKAAELGLSGQAVEDLAQAVQFNLPRGYLSVGRQAVDKIVPHLKAGVASYDKAVEAALGRSHSDFRPDTLLPELPYYGQVLKTRVRPASDGPKEERDHGRIGNVTVHIALNELRKVINALIHRYGPPAMIVLETSRDLAKSAKELRDIDTHQKAREKENEEFGKEYGENLAKSGKMGKGKGKKLAVGLHEARRRLRLAKRQGNACVYTGKPFGRTDLFTEAYEIDHIVPLSIGGTDDESNMALCLAGANRKKKDRTPYEAFHGDAKTWNQIQDAVAKLPEAMRWRFGPDARARVEGEDTGWAPRQITDTSYIARLAREYLCHVCKETWTTKGKLTALLRSAWDLPVAKLPVKGADGIVRDVPKKRLDHRHHFVDAAVIAVTSRSLVQRVNTLAARGELKRAYEADIDPPYPGFEAEVAKHWKRVWPSMRPDHSLTRPSGALHNETLYGIEDAGKDAAGKQLVRLTRRIGVGELFKPLGKFVDDAAVEAQLESFVSDGFRDRFRKVLARHREGAKCLAEAAIKAAADPHWGPRGIGEIKCFRDAKPRTKEDVTTIPRGGKKARDASRPAVDTNANAWLEIRRDGKKWKAVVISRFEAKSVPPPKTDDPNLVAVLRRGDPVAWERGGKVEYGYLKVMVGDGRIYFWPLRVVTTFAALSALRPDLGVKTRDGVPFRAETFRKAKGRPLSISVLGRVRDPGPSKS
ncbi:MAG: type II CRISPR RNA-guided endonuclease Cas9 [Alphaproteobacteria bacterium]|nr:type II CRISPR RNA-guided endonuclease Cas9 [Alphaproteobacteria bacterium]